MPELPEVQTIVDDLNNKIRGDMVVDFWSEWPKALKDKSLKAFKKEIAGRKILGARRIGKNILVDLSGKKTLYIHLKMTGHLLVKSKKLKVKSGGKNYFDDRVNQYVHHVFYLKTQSAQRRTKYDKTLEFSDLRKFGKIILANTDKIKDLPEIKSLGADAMSREFNLKKFREILEKKAKSPIGIVLMDQSVIAGIGNIYRSEILFDAKMNPHKLSEKISEKEIKILHKSIKKILKKAIKMRGTSDSDYRDTSGAPGEFHKALKVYRKNGQKCKKCGNMIKRIKMGQRSVFYCPDCQK
ncbi:MAG: bifunctional DNA-formamidopyrimidine glycosylase/DNA-(apurinic or apyrimidinic site) lyase [Candidatus Moranbacteria bacterium]|jgi:formamidopyrimidine-DNA glycosylase|nr:bifunctional DNA-formamidopyrimidine glycosylase/DNA-(apurinic or apyrimidinic site) lyase [Candidatus Moranbacteria bacterium]MDX9855898.1 bifunctional DNA-formamidopyrimidine glycosylase/DNA-(apurinic or apyrimidinic site) lyase [Candidatus Moranbacteria bacterium]